MSPTRILAAVLLAAAVSAESPHLEGTGTWTRKVTTSSAEAQAWFDDGLRFMYGFNHEEAIKCFRRAGELDPACAMAAWGEALANGPHINNPYVDEAHGRAAWAALTRAKELVKGGTDTEKDLVGALEKRYANPPPQNRTALEAAYADAMREVWRKHRDDADVGSLFAEAMLDLRPWDQWTADGKAQPGTEEIVATLEAVLQAAPRHPLANHLFIHAVEASPDPARADAAADALRDLTPGLGHLMHMPSHVDIRRGRWPEAIVANEKAIAADTRFMAAAKPAGFYPMYMAHARHMLAFAALMTGQSKRATDTIREMLAALPKEFLDSRPAFLDGYFALPYELHVRFGRWKEMLEEPEPAAQFPVARALRLQARASSLAATGKLAEARAEQKLFRLEVAKVPKDSRFGKNASGAVLGVADAVLEGEICAHEGRIDDAVTALRDGVAKEAALRYDEPPKWLVPVRHALGATLMRAGKAAEAEAVYLEDLKQWPDNGWALKGLSLALKAQGKDSSDAEKRFAKAWEQADIAAPSSCLCLPPR
jgi:tetratricopeptide (TPR) repeat protein